MTHDEISMALQDAKRIHIMGVCGTAMGTFAGMLVERGIEVRGSDVACYPPMSDQLEALGIPVMLEYKASNLDWNPDFVVVGNVIRRTNPEAVAMRERELPHTSFPTAFSELLLKNSHPIVVTGTHGKTTTTSLTAWLMTYADHDPGMMVGGIPLNFGSSFRLGNGQYFVVEGDEYDTAYFDKVPKFVHYRPCTGVITNIEFDHADIYANVEAIEAEFLKFAGLLPQAGRLLYWNGCARAKRAAQNATCTIESYGLETGDWRATQISMNEDGTQFTLEHNNEQLGEFSSPLHGDYNLQNTVGALAAVISNGVAPKVAAQGLAEFKGVKKRQEIKGTVRGVTVIDDFAHHPTAVSCVVSAIQKRYPKGRLWCCFEVESNTSRRRIFQDAYPPAFTGAHCVLFCKPLAKADNLPEAERLSLTEVVNELQAHKIEAHVIPEVDDIVQWLTPRLEAGDVVLGISGRHFYGLHDKLLQSLSSNVPS